MIPPRVPFAQVAPKLGYDLLTRMQADLRIGGPSAGFEMVNTEGGVSAFYGTTQAQLMGGFDPAAFDAYLFEWLGSGSGNAGTVTAFDKAGGVAGRWTQQDESLGESIATVTGWAAAVFGGLGLAGAGPLGGVLGGTGTTAAASAAPSAAVAAEGAAGAAWLESAVAADLAASQAAALASIGQGAGFAAIEAAALAPVAVSGAAAAGAAAGAAGGVSALVDGAIASAQASAAKAVHAVITSKLVQALVGGGDKPAQTLVPSAQGATVQTSAGQGAVIGAVVLAAAAAVFAFA